MHIHLGAVHLVSAFLGIIAVGVLWRIAAFKLAASDNQVAQDIGQAMAFAY